MPFTRKWIPVLAGILFITPYVIAFALEDLREHRYMKQTLTKITAITPAL